MQKTIEKDKGIFKIGYWDNSYTILEFINGNYLEPIRVTFIPNCEMTQTECENYTNKHVEEIIDVLKNIIEENIEFYQNFEIQFNSKFNGYCLSSEILKSNSVINSFMTIDCRLIEKTI